MKGVIHWVSADKGLPAEIRLYDRLFTVPNPAAADNFAETINPDSLQVKRGFVEPSLASAEAEKGYQFERMGYFCADAKTLKQMLWCSTARLAYAILGLKLKLSNC